MTAAEANIINLQQARIVSLGSLQPKQLLFCQSRKKYVAYGGARAGGKSWVVRFKAKGLALYYPGIKILIVRRTYPELVRNHIDTLRLELNGVAKYNSTDKRFTFTNGSVISFGYFNCDGDATQYQGAEFDIIFIDEATTLEESWLKVFPPCLRGVNGMPKRIYYTCNPGGVSHHYIKRLFIDKKYEQGENADDYEFIQALPQDNEILMRIQPGYLDQLRALPYHIRQAWLYGSWELNEGAVFSEFRDNPEGYASRQWSHVVEPFDIPEHWPIYRSMDWGYNAPFSIGWWAVGDRGEIYRILEWYGMGNEPNTGLHMPAETVFERVRNIENQHPWLRFKKITGTADPACWQHAGAGGPTVAEIASKYQVYFSKGDHARVMGWLQMHYRLEFDENGLARMYFFKNCVDTIRTMPMMQYDKHNIEDLDTKMEDHAMDECRYMCMCRPISPLKATKQQLPIYDPLATTA